MHQNHLEAEYRAVSIEMSNPFAKLGEFSLSKFRGFTQYTSSFTQKALAKIDVSHANGLYTNSPEVQTAIKQKQVQYTDFFSQCSSVYFRFLHNYGHDRSGRHQYHTYP